MMKRIAYGFVLLFTVIACSKNERLFENPSPDETGLFFENQLTETDELNILDYLYFYNGGGVAIGDINGDDLPDVFLSGNQVKNKLFLNLGDLKFEDITEQAGVAGNSAWNTGAIMGDINGDGLLDIYVCAVVGLKGFDGHNELFINNGDNTFTESAAQYGLDFESYSSNAALLDYDLDGDLDMYLLNHAVHTQDFFGEASLRNQRTYETGDKLLRNDGDTFTDVSEQAGIFGGINGYGLGVSIADFNHDGWPDIYVGNDFHEDDYYYLNNGNGTFTESIRTYFGHTSRFSMGNDVADINGDAWPDLISLDMLPEDEAVLKASEGDDDIQTQRMRIDQFGYHYQFTRNMLYLNRGTSSYEEVALQRGIAATDWSWSALFADFDHDGAQDLFISNGIPKRPNDLDFIKFLSSDQIRSKINNTRLVDQKAFDLLPSGAVHNYVFKGDTDGVFQDQSGQWITKDTLISGATALADLDADGDLDLVTNNLNQAATIYQNTTNAKQNYLKIKLTYQSKNAFAIGSKVIAYTGKTKQYKELYTVRGFQSSSEPVVHFGLGAEPQVDSLHVIWPDKTIQKLTNVKANQLLTIAYKNSQPLDQEAYFSKKSPQLFKRVENSIGITYSHVEDKYTDFNRQKLIPYQASDRGPALAYGDLNGDGKKDLFFGSSKFQEPKVFINQDSLFVPATARLLDLEEVFEETAATLGDFNGDGRNDIFLGTGGADFFGEASALKNQFYIAQDSTFAKIEVPEVFQNAAVVKPEDYDGDGDLDIFMGNHIVTNDFGQSPPSYLLTNENGRFSIAQEFTLGMLTDAIWDDVDQDGKKDLIVVGEWMAPRILKNEGTKLVETDPIQNLEGLWQSVHPFDIDQDGDTDYLLGNWGNNSKFRASTEAPMLLYYGDFDANGQSETITAIKKGAEYYSLEGLDALAGQLVFLRKKFPDYRSFAGKPLNAILDKELLQKAMILRVHELRSGYLENTNGSFQFVPFGARLQIAPLTCFVSHDFDGDGQIEALAAGNYFGVKPYHGRLDSFGGALFNEKNDVILGFETGLNLSHKSARHLTVITLGEQEFLLVTYNDEEAEAYQLMK